VLHPALEDAEPQLLAIPDVLAPSLRAWWEQAGRPNNGPVFPARLGKNAGGFRRARSNSFAARLRRELFRAGVMRLPPVEVPATKRGTRTDLGRRAEGTVPAPDPADPLYFETLTTLSVDFHSFRRSFNTAPAEADVRVQKAMALAAHSDPKVHARYVMRTRKMRTMPEAALPRLPFVVLAGAAPSNVAAVEAELEGAGIVTAYTIRPRLRSEPQ
jgi:integrase